MPFNIPFRRKTVNRPRTDKDKLQAELNEAVERLIQFSGDLRQELEKTGSEEGKNSK